MNAYYKTCILRNLISFVVMEKHVLVILLEQKLKMIHTVLQVVEKMTMTMMMNLNREVDIVQSASVYHLQILYNTIYKGY